MAAIRYKEYVHEFCSTRLLLWLFEIFYRNPMSAIFKMAAVPANFNFQIGSIAEKFLHGVYNNFTKFHAFTTYGTIVLTICTDHLDYRW